MRTFAVSPLHVQLPSNEQSKYFGMQKAVTGAQKLEAENRLVLHS